MRSVGQAVRHWIAGGLRNSRISALNQNDDHLSRSLRRLISKTTGRISNHGTIRYHESMAGTIFTYRRIFAQIQQLGISELVEVGPGPRSVVASANALLSKRLLYSAFEANRVFADSLRAFCDDLGLIEHIRNDIFTLDRKGSNTECLVFEHSLEDWFLYHLNNSAPYGMQETMISPKTIDLDLVNVKEQFGKFLNTAIAGLAQSRFGAIVFHHYVDSDNNESARQIVDMVAIMSPVFSEFANAGWTEIVTCHQRSLPLERWVVYRRANGGA